MISNITKIEVKIGERVYQFLCANDSPVGEVHDAVCAMKSFVIQRINEADKAPSAEPEGE